MGRSELEPGAVLLGEDRCRFAVWAPRRERVAVRLLAPPGSGGRGAPHRERRVPLERAEEAGRDGWQGWWTAAVDGVGPGARYLYVLDNAVERPDPASRLQPEGVHGPSEVVAPPARLRRVTSWRAPSLAELVIYELHVGTFTPEGTLDAIVPRLDALAELGVTAVELMPVAAFPGRRNWGYDGVYPFAVHAAYGGPPAYARLVDACHERGLAVIQDVVQNHLGPEGNYLRDFGPYFTDAYHTPWGEALNFDGPGSDHVRAFWLAQARYFLVDLGCDGLRMDAIDTIVDPTARHFLEELTEARDGWQAEAGRPLLLVAESDLNAPRVIRPRERGGYGIDAQWSDDLHHALHALLTGEDRGYYVGFGRVADVATALADSFVYAGRYSAHRGRRHGAPATDTPTEQHVVCLQNHDQVGNRMRGDRLATLVPFEALKVAAGTLLLSPYVPLLFMGEEYGETNPFPYFVHHGDPDLVEAVRRGRREEFARFAWEGEPPDPPSEATFASAVLDWGRRDQGRHAVLREWYRTLLALRRDEPTLRPGGPRDVAAEAFEAERVLVFRRGAAALVFVNFGDRPAAVRAPAGGPWTRTLDSAEAHWLGPGSALPARLAPGEAATAPPLSIALYLAGGAPLTPGVPVR
jgi:maltooligosyltrehalose trehalohydrolase